MKVRKNKKIEKERKVSKNNKLGMEEMPKISFREILDEKEEDKMREALDEVLQNINQKGRELINERTVKNLLDYKKMVKNFVEEAVDYGLKLNARRGFGLSGRTKILRTVTMIDERLVELTDIILKQESKGVKLLNKVGQIEGLLVNIFV